MSVIVMINAFERQWLQSQSIDYFLMIANELMAMTKHVFLFLIYFFFVFKEYDTIRGCSSDLFTRPVCILVQTLDYKLRMTSLRLLLLFCLFVQKKKQNNNKNKLFIANAEKPYNNIHHEKNNIWTGKVATQSQRNHLG